MSRLCAPTTYIRDMDSGDIVQQDAFFSPALFHALGNMARKFLKRKAIDSLAAGSAVPLQVLHLQHRLLTCRERGSPRQETTETISRS